MMVSLPIVMLLYFVIFMLINFRFVNTLTLSVQFTFIPKKFVFSSTVSDFVPQNCTHVYCGILKIQNHWFRIAEFCMGDQALFLKCV